VKKVIVYSMTERDTKKLLDSIIKNIKCGENEQYVVASFYLIAKNVIDSKIHFRKAKKEVERILDNYKEMNGETPFYNALKRNVLERLRKMYEKINCRYI